MWKAMVVSAAMLTCGWQAAGAAECNNEACRPAAAFDGGTIWNGVYDSQVPLADIKAPAPGSSGESQAREVLQRLLDDIGPSLRCTPDANYNATTCARPGSPTTVNAQIVAMGWAWALGPRYRAEEQYARDHHLGLWANSR